MNIDIDETLPETFDEATTCAGDAVVFKAISNAYLNMIAGILIENGLTTEDEFLEGLRWHYDHIRNEIYKKKDKPKWN